MSDKSAASSGIGFFSLWQVINLVLYWGIDAPWNRVQRWPFFDWLVVQSVLFPAVACVVGLAGFLVIVGVCALVTG